jgi:hypothetical protein
LGTWTITQEGESYKALFIDSTDQLLGFVLTNALIKERMALTQKLPPLISNDS